MGLWHVFYEDWQMECCGTPFSVGDEVGWPLLLSNSGLVLGGGWHDQLTKVVRPVRDGVLRDENGLAVAVQGRRTRDSDRVAACSRSRRAARTCPRCGGGCGRSRC